MDGGHHLGAFLQDLRQGQVMPQRRRRSDRELQLLVAHLVSQSIQL